MTVRNSSKDKEKNMEKQSTVEKERSLQREREKEGNTVNQINFRNDNKNSFFTDQLQPYDESTTKKGSGYKINPVSVIKSKTELRESEVQKKGIKLLGYNSSLPRKSGSVSYTHLTLPTILLV